MANWVAARVGISRSYMSHIVAGRRIVSAELASKIADTLNVPFFVAFELSDGDDSVSVEAA